MNDRCLLVLLPGGAVCQVNRPAKRHKSPDGDAHVHDL